MSSGKRGWSIRSHLAGGLAVVTVAVLATLLLVLDHWVDAGIDTQLDQVLVNQARSIEIALQRHDQATLEQVMPVYRLPDHAEFFTIYDAGGNARLHSSNSRGQALPLPAPRTPLPAFYDVRNPDDHAARALARPLTRAGHAGWTLVVSTEREDWDRFESRIHSALMAGIALATLVVVGLSLLLVRLAFAPLMREGQRIAHLDARQLADMSLGEGLPRELRPFASAFETGVGRLYQAIERERRFSRDIAHELRTPVTEIRLGAEVALESGSEDALRDGLQTAIAASERMQRSVDTLLALARYESGQDMPALDPLDLARLLADQLDWSRAAASERGLSLAFTPSSPVWIHSDAGMLERILSNLLGNAIEYAPAGGRIGCRIVRNDDGYHYWLRIDNAAPDLSDADLEHFGTRFWRKGEAGGTARHAGLGLALADGLAQALGVQLRFGLEHGRLVARLGPFATL